MLPLHISCSLVRGFMGISLPPDARTIWSQLDLASCQVVSSTDVSVPLVAAHKSSALAWAAWSIPICGISLPYRIPDLNALAIADTNPAQGVTWSEFPQRLHPKTKYFALYFVPDIKFLATNWASSSNPLARHLLAFSSHGQSTLNRLTPTTFTTERTSHQQGSAPAPL